MLFKQDRNEAVLAVDGRLTFIEKEMYDQVLLMSSEHLTNTNSKRVETQISEIQVKSESKKMEVR